MLTSAFRPFRILVLASIGAGISTFGLAQQAEFTLTPQLATPLTVSASLTDDPHTAPVTTLAIDLLAPQRPFIYDPTGSSVSWNTLDPAVYSSALLSPAAETDTSLRDASQTGQFSLYAPGASRSALSLSAVAGATSSPGRSGSAAEPLADADSSQGDSIQGYDREGGSDYRSSWGVSSSFGTQTAESSWGVKSTGVSSRGVNGSASFDRSGPLDSAFTSTSSLSVSSGRFSDSSTARSENQTPGSRSSQGRRSSLDRGASLGRSPSPSRGSSSGNEYPRSSSLYGQDQALGAGRGTMPGASYPAGESGLSPLEGGGAGRAQNGGASSASSEGLAFSSQSRRGYSSSRQSYVFGETPFSSPGGSGELTFLNPNVFAVGFQGLPSSSDQATVSRQSALREGLNPTSGLATSANDYGLPSHPRTTEARLSGNRREKSKKKNPYLTDSEAAPDDLQRYGLEDQVSRP